MEPTSKDKRTLSEFFQQVWSQALVTVTGAEEEVAKLVGRVQGMAGWSQDEARRHIQQFSERLAAQRKELERRAEESVKASMHRLKVPRREEIAQLNARLAALTKRVEALTK
ncbi:MAG: phasin family protein [Myxococcota bacterium]